MAFIRNFSSLAQRNRTGMVCVMLALIIIILYFPALTSFFISDDFSYVGYLTALVTSLLNGQRWADWFLGGIDGGIWFRPVAHLFMLLDFIAWRQNPFGYHFTNILFHFISAFEIFLLLRLLKRSQVVAVTGAVVFAVLPIHVGAVSWIAARYDVVAASFYLASFIFYILYQRRKKIFYYFVALAAFILALSSKEMAATLPAILFLSEIFFNARREKISALVKRLSGFALILAAYLGMRFFLLGPLGYSGLRLIPEGIEYWMDGNLRNMTDPFFSEISSVIRVILFALALILFLLHRPRREIAFSLLWLPITLAPTLTTGPFDRSFYIPSAGVAITIATVFANSFAPVPRAKILKMLALGSLLGIYCIVLFARNQDFNKAGQVAQTIPEQVKALRPTLPVNARLVFVGVPDRIPEGALVYFTGFPGFLGQFYGDQKMDYFRYAKFPIWLDDLDRTFFFQVDHRRVIERADLVRALEQRKQCASQSFPARVWDFSQDAQGWEPANQLTDVSIQDHALAMRARGDDPNLLSPALDIPSLAIGDISITMRARANQTKLTGELFWLATDQADFSPGLKVFFDVLADDEYHTYRVDIAKTFALLMGDRILQLRFDPVDAPAEIALKEIRVATHCSNVNSDVCDCGAALAK